MISSDNQNGAWRLQEFSLLMVTKCICQGKVGFTKNYKNRVLTKH